MGKQVFMRFMPEVCEDVSGEGNIDFSSILKSLDDYNGNYIIEARNPDDAVSGKAYLEELASAHGLSI